jgi:hypothetical protein
MFGEFVTKSLSTVSVVIGSNYYCNTCSRCNCFGNDFVNVTFLCNYPKIVSLRLVCQNMGSLQLNQLSCNFVRIMWLSILKCWNKQLQQHNIKLTLPFKLSLNIKLTLPFKLSLNIKLTLPFKLSLNIKLTLPFKLSLNINLVWALFIEQIFQFKSCSKLLYPIYFDTSNYVGFTISLITHDFFKTALD